MSFCGRNRGKTGSVIGVQFLTRIGVQMESVIGVQIASHFRVFAVISHIAGISGLNLGIKSREGVRAKGAD